MWQALRQTGNLNVGEMRVKILDVMDAEQVVHQLQIRLASFLQESPTVASIDSAVHITSDMGKNVADILREGREVCRELLSALSSTETSEEVQRRQVSASLAQRDEFLNTLTAIVKSSDAVDSPAYALLRELGAIVTMLRAYADVPWVRNPSSEHVQVAAGLQRRTGDKATSAGQSEDRDGDVFYQLRSLMRKDAAAEVSYNTTADLLVRDTFDDASLSRGLVIGREGAGRIQAELLHDVFVVSGVKFSQGAVVFEGRHDRLADPAELAEKLQRRYQRSNLSREVDYAILASEPLPSADTDMRSSLDDAALQNSSPAVVFFPRSWNTTASGAIRSPWKNLYRRLLSSAALTTALLYAGDSTGAFLPGSAFLTTGAVSANVVPLLLTNAVIQNTAALVEYQFARYKGVLVDQTALPSLSQALFNFGKRSTYLTPPGDRMDMFDIALSGVVASLTLSAGAIYAGLQITSRVDAAALLALPTIPAALLQVNTIISQLFEGKMAQITDTAQGVLTASPPAVHLHWLAIAGISTFIATTLQLIPLNNSAGR
jgi:hypothetical protein